MNAIPAQPQTVHIADIVPRPRFFQAWERQRHMRVHWFIECVAEFVSVLSPSSAPGPCSRARADGCVFLRVCGRRLHRVHGSCRAHEHPVPWL